MASKDPSAGMRRAIGYGGAVTVALVSALFLFNFVVDRVIDEVEVVIQPCQHGGSWVPTLEKCSCVGPWSGPYCSDCTCENSGVCDQNNVNVPFTGTLWGCRCPDNWLGGLCDLCTTNRTGGERCAGECLPGYSGSRCETTCVAGATFESMLTNTLGQYDDEVDLWIAGGEVNACSGHGSCDYANDCDCDLPTWFPSADGRSQCARTCASDSAGQLCYGHGACTNIDNIVGCVCEDGWHLYSDCSVPCPGMDIWVQQSCSGKGICSLENGVPACECLDLHLGEACQYKCPTNEDGDSSVACNGHGVCSVDDSPPFPKAACACANGWVGESCQCNDAQTCSGHGTCTSGGVCECNPFWKGSRCNACVRGRFGSQCTLQCDERKATGASTPVDDIGCNSRGVCAVSNFARANEKVVCGCAGNFDAETHCHDCKEFYYPKIGESGLSDAAEDAEIACTAFANRASCNFAGEPKLGFSSPASSGPPCACDQPHADGDSFCTVCHETFYPDGGDMSDPSKCSKRCVDQPGQATWYPDVFTLVCKNQGTCAPTGDACVCPDGYSGKDCGIACGSGGGGTPCSGHGSCVSNKLQQFMSAEVKNSVNGGTSHMCSCDPQPGLDDNEKLKVFTGEEELGGDSVKNVIEYTGDFCEYSCLKPPWLDAITCNGEACAVLPIVDNQGSPIITDCTQDSDCGDWNSDLGRVVFADENGDERTDLTPNELELRGQVSLQNRWSPRMGPLCHVPAVPLSLHVANMKCVQRVNSDSVDETTEAKCEEQLTRVKCQAQGGTCRWADACKEALDDVDEFSYCFELLRTERPEALRSENCTSSCDVARLQELDWAQVCNHYISRTPEQFAACGSDLDELCVAGVDATAAAAACAGTLPLETDTLDTSLGAQNAAAACFEYTAQTNAMGYPFGFEPLLDTTEARNLQAGFYPAFVDIGRKHACTLQNYPLKVACSELQTFNSLYMLFDTPAPPLYMCEVGGDETLGTTDLSGTNVFCKTYGTVRDINPFRLDCGNSVEDLQGLSVLEALDEALSRGCSLVPKSNIHSSGVAVTEDEASAVCRKVLEDESPDNCKEVCGDDPCTSVGTNAQNVHIFECERPDPTTVSPESCLLGVFSVTGAEGGAVYRCAVPGGDLLAPCEVDFTKCDNTLILHVDQIGEDDPAQGTARVSGILGHQPVLRDGDVWRVDTATSADVVRVEFDVRVVSERRGAVSLLSEDGGVIASVLLHHFGGRGWNLNGQSEAEAQPCAAGEGDACKPTVAANKYYRVVLEISNNQVRAYFGDDDPVLKDRAAGVTQTLSSITVSGSAQLKQVFAFSDCALPETSTDACDYQTMCSSLYRKTGRTATWRESAVDVSDVPAATTLGFCANREKTVSSHSTCLKGTLGERDAAFSAPWHNLCAYHDYVAGLGDCTSEPSRDTVVGCAPVLSKFDSAGCARSATAFDWEQEYCEPLRADTSPSLLSEIGCDSECLAEVERSDLRSFCDDRSLYWDGTEAVPRVPEGCVNDDAAKTRWRNEDWKQFCIEKASNTAKGVCSAATCDCSLNGGFLSGDSCELSCVIGSDGSACNEDSFSGVCDYRDSFTAKVDAYYAEESNLVINQRAGEIQGECRCANSEGLAREGCDVTCDTDDGEELCNNRTYADYGGDWSISACHAGGTGVCACMPRLARQIQKNVSDWRGNKATVLSFEYGGLPYSSSWQDKFRLRSSQGARSLMINYFNYTQSTWKGARQKFELEPALFMCGDEPCDFSDVVLAQGLYGTSPFYGPTCSRRCPSVETGEALEPLAHDCVSGSSKLIGADRLTLGACESECLDTWKCNYIRFDNKTSDCRMYENCDVLGNNFQETNADVSWHERKLTGSPQLIPCSGRGRCTPQGACVCDSAKFLSLTDPITGLRMRTGANEVGSLQNIPVTSLDTTGFRGDDCSKICPGFDPDVSDMSKTCSGHGICTRAATCQCSVGYTGVNCELPCPRLNTDGEPKTTCSGHGTCSETRMRPVENSVEKEDAQHQYTLTEAWRKWINACPDNDDVDYLVLPFGFYPGMFDQTTIRGGENCEMVPQQVEDDVTKTYIDRPVIEVMAIRDFVVADTETDMDDLSVVDGRSADHDREGVFRRRYWNDSGVWQTQDVFVVDYSTVQVEDGSTYEKFHGFRCDGEQIGLRLTGLETVGECALRCEDLEGCACFDYQEHYHSAFLGGCRLAKQGRLHAYPIHDAVQISSENGLVEKNAAGSPVSFDEFTGTYVVLQSDKSCRAATVNIGDNIRSLEACAQVCIARYGSGCRYFTWSEAVSRCSEVKATSSLCEEGFSTDPSGFFAVSAPNQGATAPTAYCVEGSARLFPKDKTRGTVSFTYEGRARPHWVIGVAQCSCSQSYSFGFWAGGACQSCDRFWGGDACTKRCPGVVAGEPCFGNGECLWGSKDGLGDAGTFYDAVCLCGDPPAPKATDLSLTGSWSVKSFDLHVEATFERLSAMTEYFENPNHYGFSDSTCSGCMENRGGRNCASQCSWCLFGGTCEFSVSESISVPCVCSSNYYDPENGCSPHGWILNSPNIESATSALSERNRAKRLEMRPGLDVAVGEFYDQSLNVQTSLFPSRLFTEPCPNVHETSWMLDLSATPSRACKGFGECRDQGSRKMVVHGIPPRYFPLSCLELNVDGTPENKIWESASRELYFVYEGKFLQNSNDAASAGVFYGGSGTHASLYRWQLDPLILENNWAGTIRVFKQVPFDELTSVYTGNICFQHSSAAKGAEGEYDGLLRTYSGTGHTGNGGGNGNDAETRRRACYDACLTKGSYDTNTAYRDNDFWEHYAPENVHHIAVIESSGSLGRCYCYAGDPGNCNERNPKHSNDAAFSGDYRTYEIKTFVVELAPGESYALTEPGTYVYELKGDHTVFETVEVSENAGGTYTFQDFTLEEFITSCRQACAEMPSCAGVVLKQVYGSRDSWCYFTQNTFIASPSSSFVANEPNAVFTTFQLKREYDFCRTTQTPHVWCSLGSVTYGEIELCADVQLPKQNEDATTDSGLDGVQITMGNLGARCEVDVSSEFQDAVWVAKTGADCEGVDSAKIRLHDATSVMLDYVKGANALVFGAYKTGEFDASVAKAPTESFGSMRPENPCNGKLGYFWKTEAPGVSRTSCVHPESGRTCDIHDWETCDPLPPDSNELTQTTTSVTVLKNDLAQTVRVFKRVPYDELNAGSSKQTNFLCYQQSSYPNGEYDGLLRTYSGTTHSGTQNPGTDEASRRQKCYESCLTKGSYDSDTTYRSDDFWDNYEPENIHNIAVAIANSLGRCYCFAGDPGNCQRDSTPRNPDGSFKHSVHTPADGSWALYAYYDIKKFVAEIAPGASHDLTKPGTYVYELKDDHTVFETLEVAAYTDGRIITITDVDAGTKIHVPNSDRFVFAHYGECVNDNGNNQRQMPDTNTASLCADECEGYTWTANGVQKIARGFFWGDLSAHTDTGGSYYKKKCFCEAQRSHHVNAADCGLGTGLSTTNQYLTRYDFIFQLEIGYPSTYKGGQSVTRITGSVAGGDDDFTVSECAERCIAKGDFGEEPVVGFLWQKDIGRCYCALTLRSTGLTGESGPYWGADFSTRYGFFVFESVVNLAPRASAETLHSAHEHRAMYPHRLTVNWADLEIGAFESQFAFNIQEPESAGDIQDEIDAAQAVLNGYNAELTILRSELATAQAEEERLLALRSAAEVEYDKYANDWWATCDKNGCEEKEPTRNYRVTVWGPRIIAHKAQWDVYQAKYAEVSAKEGDLSTATAVLTAAQAKLATAADGESCTLTRKCDLCQGNCDSDDECRDGLICIPRGVVFPQFPSLNTHASNSYYCSAGTPPGSGEEAYCMPPSNADFAQHKVYVIGYAGSGVYTTKIVEVDAATGIIQRQYAQWHSSLFSSDPAPASWENALAKRKESGVGSENTILRGYILGPGIAGSTPRQGVAKLNSNEPRGFRVGSPNHCRYLCEETPGCTATSSVLVDGDSVSFKCMLHTVSVPESSQCYDSAFNSIQNVWVGVPEYAGFLYEFLKPEACGLCRALKMVVAYTYPSDKAQVMCGRFDVNNFDPADGSTCHVFPIKSDLTNTYEWTEDRCPPARAGFERMQTSIVRVGESFLQSESSPYLTISGHPDVTAYAQCESYCAGDAKCVAWHFRDILSAQRGDDAVTHACELFNYVPPMTSTASEKENVFSGRTRIGTVQRDFSNQVDVIMDDGNHASCECADGAGGYDCGCSDTSFAPYRPYSPDDEFWGCSGHGRCVSTGYLCACQDGYDFSWGGAQNGHEPGYTCRECPPGQYSNSDVEHCTPCPVGTYQDQTGQSRCVACSAGTPATASVGAVSPGACITCPSGRVASSLSSKSHTDFLNLNYDESVTLCRTCGVGKYDDGFGTLSGEVRTCKDCPQGKTTSTHGMSACDVITITECDQPGMGWEHPDNVDPDTLGGAQCYLCPVGKYKSELTDYCTNCPGGWGTEAIGATECTACPEGYFSSGSESQFSCEECPQGYYGDDPGAIACKACAAGRWSNQHAQQSADTCEACAEHDYSEGTGATTPCTSCPTGYDSPGAGGTSCDACLAGEYNNEEGVACKTCAQHTYSEGTGATACTSCPTGYDSPGGAWGTGGTSCTACLVGEYNNEEGVACKTCAEHDYSEGTGATACTACPAGYDSPGTGGTSCTACLAGEYNDEEGAACKACTIHTYSEEVARTLACKNCPLGFQQEYVPVVGVPTTGEQASDRTYCETCPDGYAGKMSGEKPFGCEICSGYEAYSDEVGGSSGCKYCPVGWRSQTTSCLECPIGYSGTQEFNEFTDEYYNDGCKACMGYKEPGTAQAGYADEIGQSECKRCPQGWHHYDINNALTMFGCQYCSAGLYQNEIGALDEDSPYDVTKGCKQCPTGQISGDGQPQCYSCPESKYSADPCPPSHPHLGGPFYANEYWCYVSAPSNGPCNMHSSGVPPPHGGAWGTNQPACPFVQLGHPDNCKECPEGYFQPNNIEPSITTDSCTECPVGFTGHVSGSSPASCLVCQRGQYNDDQTGLKGVFSCKACPAGYFHEGVPGEEYDFRTAGADETANAAIAVTSCTGCPAGKYSGAGWFGCATCPSGYFKSELNEPYIIVDSGTCESNGYAYITTREECEEVHHALSTSAFSGSANSADNMPPNCITVPNNLGQPLWTNWNTNTNSAGACGYGDKSCICKRRDEPYIIVDSGTCDSNGYTNILSGDECKDAVDALALPWGSNYASSFSTGMPVGCVYSPTSDFIRFNTRYDSTTSCGYAGQNCVCKINNECKECPLGYTQDPEWDDGLKCVTCDTNRYTDTPTASFSDCKDCPAGYVQEYNYVSVLSVESAGGDPFCDRDPTLCAEGQFMADSDNPSYQMFSTGTCESRGLAQIDSRAQCKAAAAAFGRYKGYDSNYDGTRPRCFFHDWIPNQLHYNYGTTALTAASEDNYGIVCVDLYECKDCPVGYTGVTWSGTAACNVCQPGMYNDDEEGLTGYFGCKACPAGFFHDGEPLESGYDFRKMNVEPMYFIVDSGTCESNGYDYIKTEADCEAARAALTDLTTLSGYGAYTNYAKGCFATAAYVYFNTNWDSTKECGAGGYGCFCKGSNAVTFCKACGAGKYSEAEWRGCSTCPSGYFKESASVASVDTAYFQVDSGTCESNGYTNILSGDECKDAVDALALPWGSNYASSSSTGMPVGCVYSPTSDFIRFNTRYDSTTSCGYAGQNCVCKRRNPNECQMCPLGYTQDAEWEEGLKCVTCQVNEEALVTPASHLDCTDCVAPLIQLNNYVPVSDIESNPALTPFCVCPDFDINTGSAAAPVCEPCPEGGTGANVAGGNKRNSLDDHCIECPAGKYRVVEPPYIIVESGTCDSNGYAYITTQADCEAARTALGLSATGVQQTSHWSNYPRGCVTTGTGAALIFNTNTGSSQECRLENWFRCVCKTMMTTTAMTSCEFCPTGYYSPVQIGAVSCELCPLGYTQDAEYEEGKVCVTCSSNQEVLFTPASSDDCESCPAGKSQGYTYEAVANVESEGGSPLCAGDRFVFAHYGECVNDNGNNQRQMPDTNTASLCADECEGYTWTANGVQKIARGFFWGNRTAHTGTDTAKSDYYAEKCFCEAQRSHHVNAADCGLGTSVSTTNQYLTRYDFIFQLEIGYPSTYKGGQTGGTQITGSVAGGASDFTASECAERCIAKGDFSGEPVVGFLWNNVDGRCYCALRLRSTGLTGTNGPYWGADFSTGSEIPQTR